MSYCTMGLVVACGLLGVGCGAARDSTAEDDELAFAAGHRLTVGEVVGILGEERLVPNTPDVAEAVASLWTDYTLLATELLQDSLGGAIDMAPLLKAREEQRMVFGLRNSMIVVDSVVSADELHKLYEKEAPGTKVRARHVMLKFPPSATKAGRDSVIARARWVKERALHEKDFGKLARQYSQDSASAGRGGDLGFLSRGQIGGAFEEAAFSLLPGQISDPIESPFGVHIVRLEERELPAFSAVRGQLHELVMARRTAHAESVYVDRLVARANVRVTDVAISVVRRLSKEWTASSGRGGGAEKLLTFTGGEITAQEFAEFLMTQAPGFRVRLSSAPDESVEGLLVQRARVELLIDEAKKQGVQLSDAVRDSIRTEARHLLREAGRALGVFDRGFTGREGASASIDALVLHAVSETIKGERNVLPVGLLGESLRRKYDHRVRHESIANVVQEVDRKRSRFQQEGSLVVDHGPEFIS